MRKDIAEIDNSGIWKMDLSLYPVGFEGGEPIYEYPTLYAETRPPTQVKPFYRAKWTGSEWIEDMPKEEIDALNNAPKEPTEIELLQRENILLKAQAQANADRADFQEEVLTEIIMTIMP